MSSPRSSSLPERLFMSAQHYRTNERTKRTNQRPVAVHRCRLHGHTVEQPPALPEIVGHLGKSPNRLTGLEAVKAEGSNWPCIGSWPAHGGGSVDLSKMYGKPPMASRHLSPRVRSTDGRPSRSQRQPDAPERSG